GSGDRVDQQLGQLHHDRAGAVEAVAERGLPRRRLLDPRVAVAQHDRPPAAHEVDVRATVGVPLPASFGTFEELGVAGGEDGRVEVSVHAAGDDLGGPGAEFGV